MKEKIHHGGTEAWRRDCVNLAQITNTCSPDQLMGNSSNLRQIHAMVPNWRKRSQYRGVLEQVAGIESLPCPPRYRSFDKSVSRQPALLPSSARTETNVSGCGFVKTPFFSSPCLRASVVRNSLGSRLLKRGRTAELAYVLG